MVGELCGPCPDDGHALFSFQKLEVAPQPQPFGTILANGLQQGREQLGSFGDFDDGIGHDVCCVRAKVYKGFTPQEIREGVR